MNNETKQIYNEAVEVKRLLHKGLITYDEARHSPEVTKYEELYNNKVIEIAKKHKTKAYLFNKSKFLR